MCHIYNFYVTINKSVHVICIFQVVYYHEALTGAKIDDR